jgi:hypothetical protein
MVSLTSIASAVLCDLRFDSNFGLRGDLSFPEFGFVLSTTGSAVSLTVACEGVQYGNIPQSNEPTTPSFCHQLAARRYLKVDLTYVGGNADTNCSSDFDALNLKEFEVPPDQVDTLDLQAKLHVLPFSTRSKSGLYVSHEGCRPIQTFPSSAL